MQSLRNRILFHGYDGQRKFTFEHGPGWRFKTRQPAVAMFQKLNGQMIEKFRKTQTHVQSLQARARKGDVGAALELGEY